ncbi:putative RmlC-like cupin family protein [Nonomuraea thailandensis]|uniref:RmlC-like cupin family protein n=1 Tax=Nonomuraea thailandensis TaxID=1188745 RepID=A0A9X2JYZ0_9ACTN|nr:cupin domain-containing protein [Nonomuraea thailandensis]MCP2353634.1 putative RmlC-like cupin family protein [Nonomuraea thailandensis]
MTLTVQITPDEMNKYVARFKALQPNKDEYVARVGIPVEAYEYVAAKNIFFLLGAIKDAEGANTPPALTSDPGTSIFIVECPPGDGPALHAHMKTRETFMPITGTWQILFGDDGEHDLHLEPMDMIAVPPGVTRAFRNISGETAYLMAVVQGTAEEALNDIVLTPAVGAEIVRLFGEEALKGLERIGMSFDAGLPD